MRSIFVCGNAASAAGLTAAAVRETGTGDLVVEAGALVLADGGVCCIDELDKMAAAAAATGDTAALIEAMEQQTVTVSKASCCCCLPARTTLIAAANPKEGRL
ncbi:DNA replication licensing factor, putative, partial [Eimeria tenella]